MSEPPGSDCSSDVHAEHYEIRVKGHLNSRWSEWFEGLIVTNTPTGETVLAGPIADQAELHGLLARIRDLNLPLISVSRIESAQAADLHHFKK